MHVRRRPPFFGVFHCAVGHPPSKPHLRVTVSHEICLLSVLFLSANGVVVSRRCGFTACRPRRREHMASASTEATLPVPVPVWLWYEYSSAPARYIQLNIQALRRHAPASHLTFGLSTDPISGCKFQTCHLHFGISQRTLRFRTQGGLPCSRTRVEFISTLISWSPNHSCQCTICSRPLTWLAIQCLRSTVFRNLPKSARRVARSRPTLLPHGRTRRSFGGLGISSGRRFHACAAAAKKEKSIFAARTRLAFSCPNAEYRMLSPI